MCTDVEFRMQGEQSNAHSFDQRQFVGLDKSEVWKYNENDLKSRYHTGDIGIVSSFRLTFIHN